MPPKHKIPAEILKLTEVNARQKKSKRAIELREQSEIHLGNNIIKCPDSLVDDPVALEKWNYLVDLYDGFAYVTSADVDMFEQYCQTYSQYQKAVQERQTILDSLKDISAVDRVTEYRKTGIDDIINKKSTMLQKLGDKLYLSPTSRVAGLPLPKKETDKPADDPLADFNLVS